MGYQLKGIKSPGEVDIHGMGIVQLENLSIEIQEKLYKEGCKFLEPTSDEYVKLNPGTKKIVPAPTPKRK